MVEFLRFIGCLEEMLKWDAEHETSADKDALKDELCLFVAGKRKSTVVKREPKQWQISPISLEMAEPRSGPEPSSYLARRSLILCKESPRDQSCRLLQNTCH